VIRRAWHWAEGHPVVISLLILGLGAGSTFWIEEREDEREQVARIETLVENEGRDARASCRARNETRKILQDIGVDLNVAAVTANSETLIVIAEQVGQPLSPETIESLRSIGTTEATARATEIVAQLPIQDCAEAAKEAEEAMRATLDNEG
jgi:hypothetical protein